MDENRSWKWDWVVIKAVYQTMRQIYNCEGDPDPVDALICWMEDNWKGVWNAYSVTAFRAYVKEYL